MIEDLLLKRRADAGRMLLMGAARIAAIALAFVSCTTLSQQPAKSNLTVTVTDQSGAVIPGAQVMASKAETDLQFHAEAQTSGPATGQAILTLDPGRYVVRVHAAGFKSWEEKDVEVSADTRRTIVLKIRNDGGGYPGPCCFDGLIEEEHVQLTVDIPLMAMQQFVPPARRLRSRVHLF